MQRSLAHPALAPLKAWYAANVPAQEAYERIERWTMMAQIEDLGGRAKR